MTFLQRLEMLLRRRSHLRAAPLTLTIAAAGLLSISVVDMTNSMELSLGREPVGGVALGSIKEASTPVALRTTTESSRTPVLYTIGDRLKIAFYEQIQKDLAGAGGQPDRPVLSNLVEYSELTGEYVVHEDGNVFLPLLGSVDVSGKSSQELEQTLEAVFHQHLTGQVKVSIQLVDREPIYVTGLVTKPGTFKYVPGMTILHAIALAAGADSAATDHWRLLDTARERERLLKSEERLKILLARTAVLKAERGNSSPAAPNQLVALAGQSNAQELIDREKRLRLLDTNKRKGKEAALDAALAATQSELTLAREKVLQIGSRVMEKTERMKATEALRTRGATTDITYYAARGELSDARERLHEAQAAVMQIQRKVSELQQERTQLAVDAEIEREREIKDAMNTIAEEEVTRATIGSLLLTRADTYAAKPDAKEFSYTIIRRTPSGLRHLSANEVTSLQPGDILQVGARPEAVASN
jgi:protein involved in polysaccharide export with SLBB domain